jgi:hypothetical protein
MDFFEPLLSMSLSAPAPWPQIAGDPDFPQGIDLSIITPYFLILPTAPSESTRSQSYIAASETLSSLKEFLSPATDKSFNTRSDSTARGVIRITRVLREELARIRNPGVSKEVINQLTKVTRFLQNHPAYPIAPNFNGLSPAVIDEPRRLKALETALQEQQGLLTDLPRSQSSVLADQHHKFIRDTIDLAISARTQSHPYFERLPQEEMLYRLFEAPSSPLTKAHLIPFALDRKFESVSAWIESAVSVLAKFEGTGTFERRLVLYLFVTRFLFDRTFPQFDFRSRVDKTLLTKMTAIGSTVEHIRVDHQAVDWMNRSQFVTNPIDASYCLYMVVKALEMPSPGEDSDGYFAAMAEYDISNEVIVAVLCRSICVNPRAFLDYLEDWSRLTGFSGRCIAAIAFFGNAIETIDAFSVT